jgi:hypothetical protein
VPFLKFSRDRRGYEHYYVIEPVFGRRGKTRQRVLYWFRTPPNVKVGREPFDDQVMRALELQYPGITFDWEALRNTPIPSVEPEYWRERRRADRAARRAQDEDEEEAESAETASGDQPAAESPATDGLPAGFAAAAFQDLPPLDPGTLPADPGTQPANPGTRERVVSTEGAEPGRRNAVGPRRRRRRRGRGPGSSIDSGNGPSVSPNDGQEDI